jgi:hypothetical protein
MKTYAEKAAALVDKCMRQGQGNGRCHLDCDGKFTPCARHLAERIEANRRVASVVGANGDPDKSERGTWGPIGEVQGVQTRVRITE